MKTAIRVACVCASLLSPATAFAMSDADCAAAWTKADANTDGKLTESEGARYYAGMRVANKPVTDGALTKEAFAENCKADVFAMATPTAGAPLEGANSFTEAQAKDRAAAAGLSNVSALKKDDKGVWRGTATEGSKAVKVAVDFKGHVVAN
ncbi:MAG: hypothetical protein ABL901_14135 [Hyphomicrobiaceae bacterium]